MEADVAIHQVGGDQWPAMTEVSYTSAGNVGYFFHDLGGGARSPAGRRGDVRSPGGQARGARGQMKVSKSYDTELKAVSKDVADLIAQDEAKGHSLDRSRPQPTVWTIPAAAFSNSPKYHSVDHEDGLMLKKNDSTGYQRKRRPRADSEGKPNKRKDKPKRKVKLDETDDLFIGSVESSEISVSEAEQLSREVSKQEKIHSARTRRSSSDKDKGSQMVLHIKDGPLLIYKPSDNMISDPEGRHIDSHQPHAPVKKEIDWGGVMTQPHAMIKKEIDWGGVMNKPPTLDKEEIDWGGVMSNRTSSHRDNCAPQTSARNVSRQPPSALKQPQTLRQPSSHRQPQKAITKFDSASTSPKLKHKPADTKVSGLPLPSPKAKRKTGTSSSLPNAKTTKSRLEKCSSSSQGDITSPFAEAKVAGSQSDNILQNTSRTRSQSGSRLPTARSGIPKANTNTNSSPFGIPKYTSKPSNMIPKVTPNSPASNNLMTKPTLKRDNIDIPKLASHSHRAARGKKLRTVSESSSVSRSSVHEDTTNISKDDHSVVTMETGHSPFDTGFEDTSFMVQRKAGIRHDDIVVGPRRSFNSESAVDDHGTSDGVTVQHSHTVGDMVQNAGDQHIVDKLACSDKVFPSPGVSLSTEDKPTDTSATVKESSPDCDTDNVEQRWRKKEKQKLRRGTRQGDVSTESGYATDFRSDTSGCANDKNDTFGHAADVVSNTGDQSQSPNKAILEVTSSCSYANSKLPARNRESKSRIPSVDKSDSELRPKTKPVRSGCDKKTQNNPFLRMHISVPMSYDPPTAKNLEVPQKPSIDDTSVPSLSNLNEIPSTTMPKSESIESSIPKETISETKNTHEHSINHQEIKYEIKRKVEIPDGFITKRKLDSQNASIKSSLDSITPNSSPKKSIPQNSTPNLPPNESSSPEPPAIKPRFHRSAEQLLSENKLSIFNSSDNILRVDESKFSLADSNPFPRELKQSATSSSTCSKPTNTPIFTPSVSPIKGHQSPTPSQHKPSPFKKKKKSYDASASPVLGIIRRESERSEIYRRGSDRAKFLRRNDPSVEDLKKATSLRELCQSMASLLQIDDETAAEMLSAPLSQRKDLVDGLDADAIVDYLTHHGVLDPANVPKLGPGVDATQRNSSIVRQVEASGKTAVALFINALRQSGQLHLASSLDTEQRIQPVTGGQGYFGKTRHKGEVAIQIKVESLRVLAPREPRADLSINESLLEREGRVVDESEDEEEVRQKSCWCFCFSRKSRTVKSAKKGEDKKFGQKYEEVHPDDQNSVSRKDPNTKPHRTKSKEKKEKKHSGSTNSKNVSSAKVKDKSKKSKGKLKDSNTGNPTLVPETAVIDQSASSNCNFSSVPDVVFSTDRGNPSILRPAQLYDIEEGSSISNISSCQKTGKDGFDPIVMEYDPQLELVKLRAGQEELASPTRQNGQTGIMVEQWKSDGRFFTPKACRLCERVVEDFHVEMVKYFEQDRGTLVLDIVAEDSSIVVFNICMKRDQVCQLESDVSGGNLLTQLLNRFLSKVDVSSWDIRGVKYKVLLDEEQVKTALSELS